MAAFMRFLALFTGIVGPFLYPFYAFFVYLISLRPGNSITRARPNNLLYMGYL